MILVIFKNLLEAVLPFVNIYFSFLILDGITTDLSKETLFSYVYSMVAVNLAIGLTLALFSKLVNIKTEYISFSLKAHIGNKGLTMDYEQLEQKESLETLYKAKEGSNSHGRINEFCENLGKFLYHILTICLSLYFLGSLFHTEVIEEETTLIHFMNSPFLVILLFVFYFVAIIINFLFIRKANNSAYSYFEENVDNNRKFTYILSLITNYHLGKDIRIFQMAAAIKEEIKKVSIPANIGMKKLGLHLGKYNGISALVNQVVVFLTYLYIGIKAILGLATIGSILKYVSSLLRLFTAVSEIVNTFIILDIQRQYLIHYYKFLMLENKKYEGTLPIEKRDDNEYEVEFKNVCFCYPGSEEEILKDVSLKITIGKKMAIVGKNGAGKTTFIKLLCRLYDPTKGEILLNGIDIKKYDYEEYQRLFSVVFQDFKLFSFDIGQNVAASTNVDRTKVWDKLEQAGMAERVKAMEEGIGTNLYQMKEGGIEISGGEAQKIAIARALYKDSPLVILDEPTSALDPISEYEVYAKFNEMVIDKTSIYISHRMSSCRFCDDIIVFDKGNIIQIGDHNKLIQEKDGLYYALWSAQAKYYTA
jgi:ATP-binding cassette subfamily B protein